MTDRAVGELDNGERVVLSRGLVAMYVGSHLGRDGDGGRPSQEPVAKGHSVAAHVHEHPASGTLDVPEPFGVRAEVHLGLLHEVHLTECTLVGHLLRLAVLRREVQLLGVEEMDAVLFGCLVHAVALGDRHRHRLLHHHVLACRRCVDAISQCR